MPRIVFGTDGWRGVIAEDFTFCTVRTVSQAIADYLREQSPNTPVLVAYDTRFGSDRFAEQAACVLDHNDLQVLLTDRDTPSPVAAFTTVERHLAGALVITASHNPAPWNGIKFKPSFGGPASPELTKRFAAEANRLMASPPFPDPLSREECRVSLVDPAPDYLDKVKSLVDLQAIRSAKLRVLADMMHGTAHGYLDRALIDAGCQVQTLRVEHNPSFGGVNPEPIPENLEASLPLTASPKIDVGFALDGDGDRLGVMAGGEFVNPHRVLALLLLHLVRNRGWKGTVVKTVSTTQMLDILAQRYDLPLVETPVGFKYISEVMLSQDVIIGGEESGGVGLRGHIPERDAIYAALMFCEMLAKTGQPVSQLLEDLWQEVGGAYCFDREDIYLTQERKQELLASLASGPPDRMAGLAVARRSDRDGYKFFFEDGSWILIRASGTEPLVRVYAESTDPKVLASLMQEGDRMVRGPEAVAQEVAG